MSVLFALIFGYLIWKQKIILKMHHLNKWKNHPEADLEELPLLAIADNKLWLNGNMAAASNNLKDLKP